MQNSDAARTVSTSTASSPGCPGFLDQVVNHLPVSGIVFPCSPCHAHPFLIKKLYKRSISAGRSNIPQYKGQRGNIRGAGSRARNATQHRQFRLLLPLPHHLNISRHFTAHYHVILHFMRNEMQNPAYQQL